MRVLLDENVDRLLKDLFPSEFEVVTVRERGWTGMKNGDLLRAAELEFDSLVTMDRNLEHQQDLRRFDLAVVVVQARGNAYAQVAPLVPQLCEALQIAQPGQAIHVSGETWR